MNEYRKKPVVITAIKWTGTNVKEIMDFMNWRNASHDERQGLVIHTLEGNHYALVGDMIIKGVQGEFYPCKPDIFAATYEDATQAPSAPVAPDERAAFEAWAELADYQKRGEQHDVVGWYYFDDDTNIRWEAWQARAALSVQAEPAAPFMYAIKGPDGKPYYDEHCVGPTAEELHLGVNYLNDSPDAGYSVVPVYIAAPTPPTTGEA